MSGRQACLDLCYALYLAPPILGDLPKLAKLLVHSTLHIHTHKILPQTYIYYITPDTTSC